MAISTEGLPPIPKNTLSARTELLKTINEVSSGERNQSAADDPAGIAIATELVAEVASVNAARQNTVGAISAIRVAGGGLNSSSDSLLRLRDLALSAASEGGSAAHRAVLSACLRAQALVQSLLQPLLR